MNDYLEDMDKILDEHSKAAEAFHEAMIAAAGIRMEVRRLNYNQIQVDEQISNALSAMMEANRAAIRSNRKLRQ